MAITDPIVLPADVLLEPVTRLSDESRRRIECADDDFAISRPRTRVATRIIDAHAAALIARFRSATPIVEAVIAQAGVERTDPEEYFEAAIPLIERMMAMAFSLPPTRPKRKPSCPRLAMARVWAMRPSVRACSSLPTSRFTRRVRPMERGLRSRSLAKTRDTSALSSIAKRGFSSASTDR